MEQIMKLEEAIQKNGQRHLCVKSAITSGTTQQNNHYLIKKIIIFDSFFFTTPIFSSSLVREKNALLQFHASTDKSKSDKTIIGRGN